MRSMCVVLFFVIVVVLRYHHSQPVLCCITLLVFPVWWDTVGFAVMFTVGRIMIRYLAYLILRVYQIKVSITQNFSIKSIYQISGNTKVATSIYCVFHGKDQDDMIWKRLLWQQFQYCWCNRRNTSVNPPRMYTYDGEKLQTKSDCRTTVMHICTT